MRARRDDLARLAPYLGPPGTAALVLREAQRAGAVSKGTQGRSSPLTRHEIAVLLAIEVLVRSEQYRGRREAAEALPDHAGLVARLRRLFDAGDRVEHVWAPGMLERHVAVCGATLRDLFGAEGIAA